MADNLVQLGKISGVHGIKGWLKIFSETQPMEGILDYSPWLLKRGAEQHDIKVLDGRQQGRGLVAKLDKVESRNDAELLIGYDIFVKRSQLPKTAKDEYYWSDLIGLRVINTTGVELGTVSQMMETGANDVLQVDGERQRLIPFIQQQVVLNIDLKQGLMTVEWDSEF